MEMTPPPVVPRPYRRSTSDRIIGGVCGGLGRYWNVDPVILRVAFGVSLLFGGFGLFLYLALWLLVPDDLAPGNARIRDSWGLRILGAIAAFVAAGIGLALLFGQSNGGVLIGALLAGVIVWIAMSQRSTKRLGDAVPPPPPPEVGYAYGGTGGYETTALPAPPPVRRERSYLGLVGVCAAIGAVGIAWLFTDSPTAIMAAALLALGVTMLVGAFRGRARWLLIFAVPLLMLLAAVSQVQRTDFSAGEQTWYPTGNAQTYSLSLGVVDVNFDEWVGQPQEDEVTVDVTVGDIRVAAPRNWEVRVVTDEGTTTYIDGVRDNGVPNPAGSGRVTVAEPEVKQQGTIIVNATTSAGGVYIQTGAPAVGEPAPTKEIKKEKAA